MAPNKSTTVSRASNKTKNATPARPPPRQKVTVRLPRDEPVMSPFSGVSRLDVAPVTIGNTIKSSKPSITHSGDTVRVVGRDFIATIGGQLPTFPSWCLQSGVGLSPIGLNATSLRGFFQTYEKYKWNRVVAHYITSSPTSLSGDVLMMYHANHGGPKVNSHSTNFLSYALSTDSAVLGPQWTNHSVEIIRGKHDWFLTDVLNAEDVQHQADGELLVYCTNTTNGSNADSPGYLLMDYDITFCNRMLNPRVQTLPSSLFKWAPGGFVFSPGAADAAVSGSYLSTLTYSGNAGSTAGLADGDVFQVVIDTTNAVFGNNNSASMWSVVVAITGTGATASTIIKTYPITDGTTLYCTFIGTSASFFPTYDAAMSGMPLRWTISATQAVQLVTTMCCVGSISAQFAQANIG